MTLTAGVRWIGQLLPVWVRVSRYVGYVPKCTLDVFQKGLELRCITFQGSKRTCGPWCAGRFDARVRLNLWLDAREVLWHRTAQQSPRLLQLELIKRHWSAWAQLYRNLLRGRRSRCYQV